MHEIRLDRLPNNAQETKIIRVRKQVGDTVTAGDVLLDLEGKKASTPLKSTVDGIVESVSVSEGDIAKVGDVLFTIAERIPETDAQENADIIEVKLGKLPNNATEAKIIRVRKGIGDKVSAGDILFDAEGKKGSTPIRTSAGGEIKSMLVTEGDAASVGDTLALINASSMTDNAESSVNVGGYNILVKPKKKDTIESDITIIGGGPGGYVAAIQAAKLGAKVVLVEKDKVGGTCLNRGCIPTKALVRSAEVLDNLKEAEEFGCYAENVSFDLTKVMDRKNRIVSKLVGGIHYLLEKNNVTLLSGNGQIEDKDTVVVKGDKGETVVRSKHIIIATGSVSAKLPVPCIEKGNLIFSDEALELEELPRKMVIIGGGVIGMEFAFIFKSFGVDVSVVEYMDKVLAVLDDDISNEITNIAKEKGINIYTSSRVEEIIPSEDGQCIVRFLTGDDTRFIATDKVLVSVGRKPYLEGLGIDQLGIELNDRGRGIKVNERMQTNVSNIYAIGDVTNKLQLAHVASHQGIVAVKNILGDDCEMDYACVPSAIFTNPEIAVVGMSERAARDNGMDIEVGKFPFNANGKALTLGESRGFVKIIKDKATGEVVGGAILGPHATDLIAEIALAVRNNLTAEQITETIHAHPTTAEAVHEASLAVEGGALHFAG